MVSRKEFRERSCVGKRRYKNEAEAREMARHRRDETGKSTIAEYPCAFCGGWHIGNAPSRKPRL